MKPTIFDERRNLLGEGPTSAGVNNEDIKWVDVTGRKVRSRNLANGAITEYLTAEDVSFAIPRFAGGDVVGTANGPELRDVDGTLHELPTRFFADGYVPSRAIRWNDAKVSREGDLFLGTMACAGELNGGAFYQLRADGKHLRRLFGDVSCSNGLDWSTDGNSMFYIDTLLQRVDIFDVEERDIKNRRALFHFPESMGMPDGMSVDSNNNLWIAFWGGSKVRCIDGKTGEILEEIVCPTSRISSCVFAGEDLDLMIITSARDDSELGESNESGMTFIASPGVRGQKLTPFPV